jgi:hypothetical protein
MLKENNMWKVQYKPNNDAQPWSTLKTYDNKVSALLYALSISGKFFMIKVIDPNHSVVWNS